MRFVVSATGGLILLQIFFVGVVIYAALSLPAGEIVAYRGQGKTSEDIFVLDVNRSAVQNLTFRLGHSNEREPCWSPDGSQIAFVSMDVFSGQHHIYAIDMGGGNLRQLIDHPEIVHSPEWSPDGRQIAFVSVSNPSPQETRNNLYVMDSNGDDVRLLTNAGYYISVLEVSLTWSPDGRFIAFNPTRQVSDFGIYVMNADGSNEQPLIAGSYLDPVWSPNGEDMAFIGGGDIYHHPLFLMELESGQLQELTGLSGTPSSITWLPDSQHIAFVSSTKLSSSPQVYVMDIDGGGQYRFPFGGYAGEVPVWRPT